MTIAELNKDTQTELFEALDRLMEKLESVGLENHTNSVQDLITEWRKMYDIEEPIS